MGGRVGEPHALIARDAGNDVLELRMAAAERSPLLADLDGAGVDIEEVGDIAYVFGAGDKARAISVRIANPSVAMVRPGNLEDVFLRLTGRGLLD